MDGEHNGSKAYFLMDDLGVFPYFWKHPPGRRVFSPQKGNLNLPTLLEDQVRVVVSFRDRKIEGWMDENQIT